MSLSKREDIADLMENIQKVGTVRSIVDNPEIRAEIARHGFALDELVDDPDPAVRQIVAVKGYGLDTLINDPDPVVRQIVAMQGYGLDILINDSEPIIKELAQRLKEQQEN